MSGHAATIKRVAALVGLLGLSALTACGGGGGGASGTMVTPSNPGSAPSKPQLAQGKISAIVPARTQAQPGARSHQYLNASDPNSAIVVSVSPGDPAEASQWLALYGTQGFSVCFNLYTNGTVNASLNPVPVAGGVSVTFPMPAPPGNDLFTIAQYDGQCSTQNAYVPPTPSPGANGSGQLATTPQIAVNIVPGAANNFNVQLTLCTPPSSTAPTCSNATPPPGTPPTTVGLGASVSAAYLGGASPAPTLAKPIAVPIPAPIREQGAFLTAANHVGFPIPVVGLDSSGYVIGYQAPLVPGAAPQSGALPKASDSIVLSHTETPSGSHFLLYLVDAKNGNVEQTEVPGTTKIKLTQLNALNAADAPLNPGDVGDPYVVVATFDGSPSATTTSMTVTMTATINGNPSTQTLTVTPQSSLFSVGAALASGYADAAGPYTKAADILNTTGAARVAAGGQGYWVSDGANLHLVGTASNAVAGATTLTGMTLDNDANIGAGQIMAVDNSSSGAANGTAGAPINSGVFVLDPATPATNKPLAVQFGSTNVWYQLTKPQAIAYMPNGSTHYVYIATANGIIAVLPQGTGTALNTTGGGAFYAAQYMGALNVTGLNFGSTTGFDMIASGTKLIFPDTGNNRIVSIDTASCTPSGAACTAAVVASGYPFVGLSVNGSGYVATDTSGQIYTISSSGTVTSLGLATGSVADGPVGLIGSATLSPSPYAVQGNTANFFGSAGTATLPYTLSPFTNATGPVFLAAAQTAVTGAPLKLAADTSNGSISATAGGKTKSTFGIAFISAAGTNAALTSNSYLFTDNGNLRTLVP